MSSQHHTIVIGATSEQSEKDGKAKWMMNFLNNPDALAAHAAAAQQTDDVGKEVAYENSNSEASDGDLEEFRINMLSAVQPWFERMSRICPNRVA